MLERPRGNSPVDIHAWADIPDNPARHDQQPEQGAADRLHERQKDEYGSGDADRQSRTSDEEKSDPARVIDTGLYEPATKHLHVLLIRFRVMLGRVLEELGQRFRAGILERASLACPLLFTQNA